MKKLFFFLSIFFFGSIGFSQTLYFKFGYGSFSMGKIKELQTQLLTDIKKSYNKASVVESFPPSFIYQAGISFPVSDSLKIAMYGEYTSTDGQIYYSGSSEEVKLNSIAKSISLGAALYYDGFFFSSRIIFSFLNMNSYSRSGYTEMKDHIELSSASIGIEPGYMYSYELDDLIFNLSISYLINFPATMEFGNSDIFLSLNNGQEVSMDWSGFRVGIGVELKLY